MAKLSLNKAAAYAGKAKADILKALKTNDPNKKLSGQKNDRGHWEIDESELDRFFGKKGATTSQTGSENRSATPDKPPETSALEEQVKALTDEKISMLENQIDELRTERDEWRKQAQQLAIAAPEEPVEKGRGGFWKRVFGS